MCGQEHTSGNNHPRHQRPEQGSPMYVGLTTHDCKAVVRRPTAPELGAMPVMCFVAEKWLRTIHCQVHLATRPTQAGRGEKVPLDRRSSEHLLSIHQLSAAGRAAAALPWLSEEQRGDSAACPGTEQRGSAPSSTDAGSHPGMTLPMLCYRSLLAKQPPPFSTAQSAAACGALREPRSR